jgi:hypothetical protein
VIKWVHHLEMIALYMVDALSGQVRTSPRLRFTTWSVLTVFLGKAHSLVCVLAGAVVCGYSDVFAGLLCSRVRGFAGSLARWFEGLQIEIWLAGSHSSRARGLAGSKGSVLFDWFTGSRVRRFLLVGGLAGSRVRRFEGFEGFGGFEGCSSIIAAPSSPQKMK